MPGTSGERVFGAPVGCIRARPHPLLPIWDRADFGPLTAFSSLRSVGMAGRPEPAFLTSFLLRPAMHRTQRSFLTSACSTYCQVRLRAPRVVNTAGHDTLLPSRRKLMRNAAYPSLAPVGETHPEAQTRRDRGISVSLRFRGAWSSPLTPEVGAAASPPTALPLRASAAARDSRPFGGRCSSLRRGRSGLNIPILRNGIARECPL
jgi:hypothetical protein